MEKPATPDTATHDNDTFTIEVMQPNRAQRRSEAKRARKVEAWIRKQARLQQAKLARAEARRQPQVDEELLRREGWADVASSDPLADVQAAYERLTNDREVKPFVPIEPPADA